MSTFFTPVSSISEDSSCRVSSWVSACVVQVGRVTLGTIASLACSSTPKIDEVLVDLIAPSTVSSTAFLHFFSVSLITCLENGIGGVTAVFILVPSATNEGYNECCGTPGITCWKGDSSSAVSVVG